VEAGQLSWVRDEARNPETQSNFEKWLARLPVSSRPQIDPDDLGWERTLEAAGRSRPLYSLLVCSIPAQEEDRKAKCRATCWGMRLCFDIGPPRELFVGWESQRLC
jgi:hypothetical protein